MSRELAGYREELEMILNHFGNRRILTEKDVIDYTGRSKTWVHAHLGNCKDMTVTALARSLAALGREARL